MIYNGFCFLLWAIAAPFLALLPFKTKYKDSIPARFFLRRNPRPPRAKYHFHACSLGEVASVEPFVKALMAQNNQAADSNLNPETENSAREVGQRREARGQGAASPLSQERASLASEVSNLNNSNLNYETPVRLSVVTNTGFERAQKITRNTRFLPFECFLPFWWRECETLVVFEAELWLNLFAVAKTRGARTILLNARISDRSYRSYLRFAFYYRLVFARVDLTLAQSQTDKERLERLGAKNVQVVGNVKSAVVRGPTRALRKPSNHVITIASSHKDEEKNILSNLKLRENETLFVVPRHPERFAEAGAFCEEWARAKGLSFERFSEGGELNSNLIFVDKLGELINIYAITDIAILCGSFEQGIGGHNPIEPAQFGCGVISGRYVHNQRALFTAVEGAKFADYAELDALAHKKFATTIKHKCDFSRVLSLIK